MTRKVQYVAGVGLARIVPLPVCGQREFFGHKVMLLDERDAQELLGGSDFVACPDDAKVDFDYTSPDIADVLEAKVESLHDAAKVTNDTPRPERKISTEATAQVDKDK